MSKSALIVIDPQVIYEDQSSPLAVKEFGQTLKKINKLISHFEKQSLPTIYVRHEHRATGVDLGRMFDFSGEAEEPNFTSGKEEVNYVDDLKLSEDAIHIVKTRYSCFAGTELECLLKTANVDTVVICGFMTNFCCESTAREAHDKDYFVDFILDATGCPDLSEDFDQDKIRQTVANTLEEGYARVINFGDYLRI
nr:isochorismatase family cysteine hydrolase [uncultured Cohaesibacter sp.]